MFRFILLITISILMLGCSSDTPVETIELGSPTKTIELKYAKHFKIEYGANFKKLEIIEPWIDADSTERFVYYLVSDKSSFPKPEVGKVIEIPLVSVACLNNSPHVALICALRRQESITGVSGSDFVCDSILRLRIDNNEVTEIGVGSGYNFERIVELNPQVIFSYIFEPSLFRNIQKLEELGHDVVINAGFIESTPLAQLEWVKFMAAFYNEEELADSIFTASEREYLRVKKLMSESPDKPMVLTGNLFQGSWMVPGKQNLTTTYLQDAGGDHPWSTKDEIKLYLDFETIVESSRKCEVWINPGHFKNKKELLAADSRYAYLFPFKQEKIFNYTKRVNHLGWHDYWESGIIKPHLILKDISKILHPELMTGHEFYFYENMMEVDSL